MSLGIIHPPGMDGPVQECSQLYFSEWFLSQPPMWCQVALPPEDDAHAWLSEFDQWDTPQFHACLHAGYESIRLDEKDYTGWFLWPRGTLVTHEFPLHRKVIWRLTGVYWPLASTTFYEGGWPD